jgi:uncharacterized UBP type Zn finger protein
MISFGLVNNGTTCWLNSLVQIMFHLAVFHHQLQTCSKQNLLIDAFQRTFAQMSRKSTVPVTNFILNSPHNLVPGFDHTPQQDVQEMLLLTLNHLPSDFFRGTLCARIEKGSVLRYIEAEPYWDNNISFLCIS